MLPTRSFISTDDGGVRKGKQECLAELRKPEGNIHTDSDEQPEDVRVVFTGGVAIVNQTKYWTDYDKTTGISWGATSRTTRVRTCKNGERRLVAFQETDIPNKHRQPYLCGCPRLTGKPLRLFSVILSTCADVIDCLGGSRVWRSTSQPIRTIRTGILGTTLLDPTRARHQTKFQERQS